MKEKIKNNDLIPYGGKHTGLYDSNGKPIKNGDKIRYEYKIGFTRATIKGKEMKIHCVPFDETEQTFHETVMEYQVNSDCAGFFLDKPKGITSMFFSDTLKYYIVK